MGEKENEALYETTVRKIDELICDKSVSQEKALENCRGLIEHIENWMESIESDLAREEGLI